MQAEWRVGRATASKLNRQCPAATEPRLSEQMIRDRSRTPLALIADLDLGILRRGECRHVRQFAKYLAPRHLRPQVGRQRGKPYRLPLYGQPGPDRALQLRQARDLPVNQLADTPDDRRVLRQEGRDV